MTAQHPRRNAVIDLTTTAFRWFFAVRADLLSGAIAYFTVLSLAPLLVIGVALGGVVFGEDTARARVVADVASSIGPDAAGVLDELLRGAARSEHGWELVVGLAVVLWAASRIFVRVQDALNEVWGVRPKRGRRLHERATRIVQKRAGSFLLAMLVGVLLFASMGVKSVIAGVHGFTGEVPFGSSAVRVIEGVTSVVLVGSFLGVLFRWLPDVELGWRDVWPGALLTSVLAAIGAFAISTYLGYVATTSVSGAVGGVFVLLLWVYWNAQVFLLGAEFTRAYTLRRRGEVEAEPHAELVPRGDDAAS
ncbi:MAG TPA: YihY/virulence factor BrkB family protein [Nannocystaceae bacterium]|nr:YihY/virulence factor BrkB family protein [Nannocystaceae bacterium]